MKKLVFIIYFCCSVGAFAQSNTSKDLIGVYTEKSDDPVGGATIILLPDQTFAITFFGGFHVGQWQFENGKVTLIPKVQPEFVLYGRNLKSLGKTTKINFLVEPENQAMVGLEGNKKSDLKPVFNKNANCLDFPYISVVDKPLAQLHAAQLSENPLIDEADNKPYYDIYHFTVFGAYNDLILVNLSPEYTQKWSMEATFKNGKLFMDNGSEGMRQEPLESLNAEDLDFIKEYLVKDLFGEQLQYGDEFFPTVEGSSEEELKPYKRLEVLEIGKNKVNIQEGSFFTASCEDE